MRTEVQNVPERRPSIMRRAVAGLVVVAAVVLALHFIVSLVVAVFYFVLAVAVIVAVLWALKTLIW
ncbi:MAG TPA: hypothetical protein VG405_00845 [Solirubrobacteraceae bacterium]|jgi:fatty acid desaturase|nr:hypothetical protein [Solirubrobacteraceae bacterium]